MKVILLLAIRIYWMLPKDKRRSCLFKVNCSKFVYDTTAHNGFREGIKALRNRIRQCRSGYAFYNTEGKEWIIFRDKTVIERCETRL